MYIKEVELKIIRAKHKVTFKAGTTVATLLDYIKHVPLHAEVDECFENEADKEYIIRFHEERRDSAI